MLFKISVNPQWISVFYSFKTVSALSSCHETKGKAQRTSCNSVGDIWSLRMTHCKSTTLNPSSSNKQRRAGENLERLLLCVIRLRMNDDDQRWDFSRGPLRTLYFILIHYQS